MAIAKKKRLAVATMVYWFLLFYIIAALVWWFIALNQQNHQMAVYQLQELNANDPDYLQKAHTVIAEEDRKNAQFIGEGATFLLLILVSALFVYRVVRRQIKMASQQQNFMMAITHELKTPIAVAKLNLETLQKHKLEEGKQQKLIAATLQEANRLKVRETVSLWDSSTRTVLRAASPAAPLSQRAGSASHGPRATVAQSLLEQTDGYCIVNTLRSEALREGCCHAGPCGTTVTAPPQPWRQVWLTRIYGRISLWNWWGPHPSVMPKPPKMPLHGLGRRYGG